jgi:hypothetical protein
MKSIMQIFLFFFVTTSVYAQISVQFESGLVTTCYNDIRVPGDNGTLLSLNDDLNSEAMIFFRLSGSFTFSSRHTISLLYAPLSIKSEGTIIKEVRFVETIFPENSVINATYKFNSYRLTYRYDLITNNNFELGAGLTAKIRDAKIELSSPALTDVKENVGFVPLINFRLLWNLFEDFGILLEGDALAAPQGRAEDVRIAGQYNISKKVKLSAGYRILEGGADNDEVYSFALFHYASLGIAVIL